MTIEMTENHHYLAFFVIGSPDMDLMGACYREFDASKPWDVVVRTRMYVDDKIGTIGPDSSEDPKEWFRAQTSADTTKKEALTQFRAMFDEFLEAMTKGFKDKHGHVTPGMPTKPYYYEIDGDISLMWKALKDCPHCHVVLPDGTTMPKADIPDDYHDIPEDCAFKRVVEP